MKRFKTKCIEATISITEKEHFLVLEQTEENTGMFGSKIAIKQFEKIESVLSKRYIKLPFGIRILL
ncbi:MAG: hypothetical protein COA36_16720 [Desulfotalea sp.]|nr:MAG: hypothetical protein COA36_16720 [Desulfotalea sp.]